MNVMDILKSYAERPTDTHEDFDEVSRQVAPDALGNGIAEAFKSDKTPEFGNMAASLFGGSSPSQQAGLIGQLVRSVAPALLSTIAGGALGRMLQGHSRAPLTQSSLPEVSEADAANLTNAQVRDIAAAAQEQDPSVMDRIGAYYAQHPDVVKVLGGTALAIALGQIATRMQR